MLIGPVLLLVVVPALQMVFLGEGGSNIAERGPDSREDT
jgi:hypothetical protein